MRSTRGEAAKSLEKLLGDVGRNVTGGPVSTAGPYGHSLSHRARAMGIRGHPTPTRLPWQNNNGERLTESIISIYSVATSSSGPSFLTLLASGDAGCASRTSSAAGISSCLSESGSASAGFIQSSAARLSRMTGIRL